MSRKRQKTGRYVSPPTPKALPFPGPEGEEIVTKLLEGDTNAALNLFWDAYIGDPGDIPPISIIEDDGENIIFAADRGMFKLWGPARDLLLTIITTLSSENSGAASAEQNPQQVADEGKPDESQTS